MRTKVSIQYISEAYVFLFLEVSGVICFIETLDMFHLNVS